MSFESGWEKLMKALVLHRSEAAPDFVWQNIKQHLASPFHAPQNLPAETLDFEYKMRSQARAASQSPPAFVWNNIESGLRLETSVQALPQEAYWRNISQGISIQPSNDVWANIEHHLPPQRRRRPIVLIFFLLGALLFLGSISFYYSTKNVKGDFIKSNNKTNFEKAANTALLNTIAASHEEITSINEPILKEGHHKWRQGNVGHFKRVSNPANFSNSESTTVKWNAADNPEKIKNVEVKAEHTNNSLASLATSRSILSSLKVKLVLPKIECPDFSNRHKPSFFIEANLLAGAHDRSFEAASTEPSALVALRKNAEHAAYTVGGSFIAGFYMNRNVYFGSGLAYTRSKDNFKTEGISRIIINYDPVTGIPIDTIIEKKGINHEIIYTNVDLPILMGYEHFAYGWAFGVEVGALLNLKTTNDGFTYNKSLVISSIASQGDVIKTNLGLGLTGSFILRKYLTPNFSIHLKPGFKTYLNDWNENTYPVKIKSNLFYLNVGVRHVF